MTCVLPGNLIMIAQRIRQYLLNVHLVSNFNSFGDRISSTLHRSWRNLALQSAHMVPAIFY